MNRLLLIAALLALPFCSRAQQPNPLREAVQPGELRRHVLINEYQRGNDALRADLPYRYSTEKGDYDSSNARFSEAVLRAYLFGAFPGYFAGEADSLLATYTLWELLSKSAKTYFANAEEEKCLCPAPAKDEIRTAALKALIPGGFELIEDARFDQRRGKEIRKIRFLVLHFDRPGEALPIRLALRWEDVRPLAKQADWKSGQNEVARYSLAEALEVGLARGTVARSYRKSDGKPLPVSSLEGEISLNDARGWIY